MAASQNIEEVEHNYDSLRRKTRYHFILVWLLLGILVIFLMLYVICFAHVASYKMSADWTRSAGIAFLMDHLVLELGVALFVGLMGVLRSFCFRCRCLLYFALTV